MARVANNDYRQMLEEILAAETGGGDFVDGDIAHASPGLADAVSRYKPTMLTEPAAPPQAANPSQTREKSMPPAMVRYYQGDDNAAAAQEMTAPRANPQGGSTKPTTTAAQDRASMQQTMANQIDTSEGLQEDLPILGDLTDGEITDFMYTRINRLGNRIGQLSLPEVVEYFAMQSADEAEDPNLNAQWDSMSPQARMQVMEMLADSSGLATFGDVMGGMQDQKETYGPRRGQ